MIRRDLQATGAELVIGKNTVVKKALDIRANPLKADQEDFDFYNRFGECDKNLNVLRPLLVKKFGMVFTNNSVFDLKQIIASNKR